LSAGEGIARASPAKHGKEIEEKRMSKNGKSENVCVYMVMGIVLALPLGLGQAERQRRRDKEAEDIILIRLSKYTTS
jgi:hypothetical protein